MGQKSSKNLEAELDFLTQETGIERKSLEEMYENFSCKKGISKKDFINAYRKLNPKAVNPDQMAETLFKNCDTNKDGTLSFKEFAMTVYFLTKAPKEEKLKHIFLLLDTDGNGSLSSKEVMSIIKHAYDIKGGLNFDYNKKGIEIFRIMDQSGDMKINCEEFVNACLSDSELSLLLEDVFDTFSEIKSC